jgi:hypothetical protein
MVLDRQIGTNTEVNGSVSEVGETTTVFDRQIGTNTEVNCSVIVKMIKVL